MTESNKKSQVIDARLAFEFRRYAANIQRQARTHWVNTQVAEKIARDMQINPDDFGKRPGK